ncbi:MAG: acyl-CoA thioesterase [Frankia sp.]
MTDGDGRTLVDLLRLETIDRDIFRGTCHAGAPLRAFGGQVAAQALVAAGHTVESERPVHSLHGYFVRPGRTTAPIVYLVDRVRDGRTFTTRRVTGVQYGETIFTLSASFKAPESSSEHQRRMPPVPDPEQLAQVFSLGPAGDQRHPDDGPTMLDVLDLRFVPNMKFRPDPVGTSGDQVEPEDDGASRTAIWIKAITPLPDDPLTHVCALAYMSDLTLGGTAGKPHVNEPGTLMLSSLDHAMWFHRPFRADDWLLFVTRSSSLADSRGIANGEIFTQGGRLIASVVQELLIRRDNRPRSALS